MNVLGTHQKQSATMLDLQTKILLVDDDEISRSVFARVLSEFTASEVVECDNGLDAKTRFEHEQFPIVISDIRMPGLNGIELLREIRAHPNGLDTQVILITGFADVETALSALREGATEMLTKPIPITDLLQVVERAAQQWDALKQKKRRQRTTTSIPTTDADDSDRLQRSTMVLADKTIIGIFNRKFRSIIDIALRYNDDRNIPVLIEGETGTGKEVLAKVVHYGDGDDTSKPFVTVNCAAISASLFESELFGYVGGAFTGALPKGASGKMEAANGGTLFLDEVGEIPMPMQAKLLRALQEKMIYRVGGTERIPLDIRVIAATNRDLEKQVQDGGFRSDLYYRIAVGRIELPPLREQPASIPAMAQLFLAEFAREKQRDFRFISRDAVRMFEQYEWPGNVRQLRNLIEHAVLLYNAVELDSTHLAELEQRMQGVPESGFDGAVSLQVGSLQLPQDGLDLDALMYEIVRKSLDKFGGNQLATAKYLGLSRGRLRTLVAHLEKM
jgi:two-component system, NtrC family, response regulator AtoC